MGGLAVGGLAVGGLAVGGKRGTARSEADVNGRTPPLAWLEESNRINVIAALSTLRWRHFRLLSPPSFKRRLEANDHWPQCSDSGESFFLMFSFWDANQNKN